MSTTSISPPHSDSSPSPLPKELIIELEDQSPVTYKVANLQFDETALYIKTTEGDDWTFTDFWCLPYDSDQAHWLLVLDNDTDTDNKNVLLSQRRLGFLV
jgi:hypothetical protein